MTGRRWHTEEDSNVEMKKLRMEIFRQNSERVSVQGPCEIACGHHSMQDFQIFAFSLP